MMFNGLWILVAGILVFIGLVASQGLFLVVGALVIIVTLTGRLWDRYAFLQVTHGRIITLNRAFIGDTLEYTVTLSNDKILPLIWVDILDPFPPGLELSGGSLRGSFLEGIRHHRITTSLLPYQKVSWRYSLQCTARGYHRIGPVRLRSGDIFGFSSGETSLPGISPVIVYPRMIDLDELVFPAQHPLGETKGQRPLYPDASRFLGQREYQPTDPMKYIHWKGTARRGSLQTKIFDPVVSLNVLIAMNGSTNQYPWQGVNRAFFERTVTAAASVAGYCDQLGYSFGLASNAVSSYSSSWLRVLLGASPQQLYQVLDALARAAPYAVTSLADVVRGERDTLPAGTTVVLVTPVVTGALTQEVEEILDRGYRMMALYTGDGAPEMDLPGVPWIHVGRVLASLVDKGLLADGLAV